MSGARLARTRVHLLLLGLVSLAFILALPGVAFGATVWSAHQPPPLSATTNTAPAISVVLDDDYTLYPMSTVRVDGRLVRSTFKLLSYADPTKAIITAKSPLLSDGQHTIFVDVPRQAGMGHVTTSWKFTVGAPPVVSGPVPTPGQRIDDDTPLVQANVTDSGPIASVTVSIDGVSTPSTFAAGVVSAQVVTPLANDATHTVSVVAVDGAGLASSLDWALYVQTYPVMPASADCVDCHAGYPAEHPVDDCLTCHGEGGPYYTGYDDPAESHEPGGECYPCHGDLTDCTWCHGEPYVTVPALHDLTEDAYHDSSLECSPCHIKRISVEHYRYGLDCMTCHDSTDPAVLQAIAQGDPSCFACHTGGHEELHGSSLEPLCLECHQPQLTSEHGDRGLTCRTCHESTDPAVIAAIDAEDTSCTACHAGAGHVEQHSSAVEEVCEACHAPNLIGEHLTELGLSCATCHESADPVVIDAIADGDKECFACHTFDEHPYVTTPHASRIASQTLEGTYPSGASYSLACTVCHAPDLGAEHQRESSSSAAAGCTACHPVPRDTLDPWSGSCVQAGCHANGGGTEQHAAMALDHLVPVGYASCSACHKQGDAAAIHTSSASSCAACHSDTTVPTHLDCGVCHVAQLEPHGYDAPLHTAAVSDVTISGTLADMGGETFYHYDGEPMVYSGLRCGQCHTMDLYLEHTKTTSSPAALRCGACHATPRDTFESWNETCQQGGCHATYHADMAEKHHQAYAGEAASCGQARSSCHPGQWQDDLAAVHNEQVYYGGAFGFDFSPYQGGCGLCHTASSAPSTPSGCDACHVVAHSIANLP